MNTLPTPFKSLFRALLASVMFLALCGNSLAQSLSLYNINTDEFPKVVADYAAFDATGNQISDELKSTDFIVREQIGGNTVDLTPTVNAWCTQNTIYSEASIVILLDRSNSMRDVIDGGKTRFQYAKDAIKAFVKQIKFTGDTRVCLTAFSGNYELKVDWTNDIRVINDTLDKMEPTGATNYELPFSQPGNVFDLLKQRPANIPKYVFMLTDGHPNPAIGSPNASLAAERKFVDETVAKFQAQGARFYSVSVAVPNTHWTLQEIARMTGGKSVLTTEKELVDLMALLALETMTTSNCHISWISPFGCSPESQARIATVILNMGIKPTYVVPFVTPPNSIASVKISSPALFCGNPPPSQTSYVFDTLTAVNAPLVVDSYTITPATYFSVDNWDFPTGSSTFSSFTIQPGQKRILRIKFTQGAPQTFRQAKLRFTGTPCPPEIDFFGGLGMVTVSKPNGGELFSTCDSVLISWIGVDPKQPVTIEYTADDGANWNIITQTALNLQYKWLPPSPGTKYKIRISISPTPQYQWAKQVGGSGNETATSLSLSCDDLYSYSTGYYNGPFKLGSVVENIQVGNTDGYMAVFDSDGLLDSVWILRGSGNNEDRIVGAITDSACNLYVVGYFTSPTATWAGYGLSLKGGDTRNMFVFKYDRTGALQWTNYGRGDGLNYSYASADSIGIQYDALGNARVIVVGTFQRFIRIGTRAAGGYEESQRYNNNTSRPYYAIYDNLGNAISFNNGTAPAGWKYQAKSAIDKTGFTYETGMYTGTKQFSPPVINLPNAGGTDVYIFKRGAIPASNDVSDNTFSVKSPQLSFTIQKATMDPTAQGQSSPKSFTAILCNDGDFPIIINDTTMAGVVPSDFRLISNIVGTRLEKGACLNLEFEFVPSGIGVRKAILIVEGNCGNPATLELEGEGLAPCVYEVQTSIDVGRMALGQTKVIPVTCVFKNIGPIPLSGTVSGGNSEVTITSGAGPFTRQPQECLDIEITVNATTAGNKSITIDYGLAAECGVPLTTISIEVVEPRVTITSVAFPRTRVGNLVYDTIRVTNLAIEPAVLTAINVTNTSGQSLQFTVPTIPPPITLNPNEVMDIPVVFNPAARGLFVDSVFVTIQGQANIIGGEARGTGFLPEITANGTTFPSWTVMQQYPNSQYVVIKNTEASSDLHVESVYFETATADFAWDAPNMPALPVDLAPGDTLAFPVIFTPQAEGNRCVNVRIENDAKTGPGSIPPYAIESVSVCGVGLSPSSLPPQDFGNVLTCATSTKIVTIVNSNPSLPLTCNAPIATGDVNMFVVSPSSGFVIAPGGSRDITVMYDPTAVGVHSASYSYPNDQGLSLNINATGTGITAPATFTFGNLVTGQVGTLYSVPVNVDVAALDTVKVTQVVLTFSYDARDFGFASMGTPSQAGWNFDPDASTPGLLIITCTPVPGSNLVDGAFATPMFNVFLTPDSVLPISFTAQVNPDCIVGSGESDNVILHMVCAGTQRVIKLGNAQFAIEQPKPNPASDVVDVVYSTGIDLQTTFEVIDGVGNIVRTMTTPVLTSGTYQLTLDLSDLSSGLYVIRMSSGPYVESRILSIVK